MLKTLLLILLLLLTAYCSTQAQSIHRDSVYKIKTIVLDAGHGGHDSGCRGAHSNEKDVTLAIVLKLGALVHKVYPNVKVIYTRSTDEFIELYERANIANRNNADLFVSIHCNANRNTAAFGTETWLMGLHKSVDNLEVSKRENDVILLENDYQQNYDGFDPNSPEGFIILTMNQNAHLQQSIDIASKVEDEFRKDGRVIRGVKQAGFLVLWRTTMPSILVETGFLTNRTEENYLTSQDGQNKIARSVLKAIGDYKAEVEGSGDFLARTYPDSVLTADLDIKTDLFSSADSLKTSTNTTASNGSTSYHPALTYYKVQIVASAKPINLKSAPYASIKDITNDKSDSGYNRYVVGKYLNMADCQARLLQLRKKGFKSAFIVSYRNSKRIPVSQ
ncbi:MAG: N-acetylmuramoyl-L-alanine amidase [Chitinophagales bacterium]|nr:N-acetylmuramoyl-L-alanine amidase [Chitinophagales bacterium]